MAEGGGLLNRCTVSSRTVGSNPIPSASNRYDGFSSPRTILDFPRFSDINFSQGFSPLLTQAHEFGSKFGGNVLTDIKIRKLAATGKLYRLADARGLYLEVKASGARYWYFKYRWAGKEKRLAIGAYPDVSLAAARDAVRASKSEIQAGRDPSLTRKQRRAEALTDERSLTKIGDAWVKHNLSRWTVKHAADVRRSLERIVYSKLGALHLNEITAPMTLEVLKSVEGNATETAHRVQQRVCGIYAYAIASGLADRDPAADLKSILKPVVKKRQPAILEIARLRQMLRDIEGTVHAYPVTLLALRLLALTAVRSNEVRGMRWDEVDGDIWRILATRMKMRRPHVVYLTPQAMEILEAVKPFAADAPLVFPSRRWASKPMSDMAMSVLIKNGRSGQECMSFRASVSSIMNERRPHDRFVIDQMLAHSPKDAVEAVYNRVEHLETRRAIAQEWADLLLEGAVPAMALRETVRR